MTIDDEPLVTVLTPVYNGERYLRECIQSVLNQTYRNWEYVIVNNCSTDATGAIAAEYASGDPRVRLHNNTAFVTAMQNHDIAFRSISAQSKYCKVVHADDWLFPECLTRMVDLAERHPSVGVVGAYSLEGDRVILDGLPYPSTVVAGRTMGRWYLLGGPYVFGNPSAVLYRADLVRQRQPFYRERWPLWADLDACLDLLRGNDFGFVHQVLTFTRRHAGATSQFAQQVNTYMLGGLELLVRHGPAYLDSRELKLRLEEMVRAYRRFLGQSLFQRPTDKEFWHYHMTGLREIGLPMTWPTVAGAALLAVFEVLGYPLRAARKVLLRSRHAARTMPGGQRSASIEA